MRVEELRRCNSFSQYLWWQTYFTRKRRRNKKKRVHEERKMKYTHGKRAPETKQTYHFINGSKGFLRVFPYAF